MPSAVFFCFNVILFMLFSGIGGNAMLSCYTCSSDINDHCEVITANSTHQVCKPHQQYCQVSDYKITFSYSGSKEGSVISRRGSVVPQADSSIRLRVYVCMYVMKCVRSHFSEMAQCFFSPLCRLIASML